MKTLLYTGYDTAYAPLAAITVPRMECYALRHKLDFKEYTEPLIDVPNGIYWTGVCGALKAFENGYERAIYLDVDILITNMKFDINGWLERTPHGLHASLDWGSDATKVEDVSACVLISHRDSVSLLETVLRLEKTWRGKPFPEQAPLRDVMGRYTYPSVSFWPRKPFNCVPDQIAPGNVPEPWAEGDFAAHLTMRELDDRIKIAHEILQRIV